MLGATLLWFCGQTIMWSFVERIGSAAGHSSEEVGNVLAACLAAAMSGSIVATFIGDRFVHTTTFYDFPRHCSCWHAQ